MGRGEASFHGYCGQKAVVSSIREHCNGALSKGIPLPHIMLSGQSGMGKTQLAKAIAAEMGTTCHEVYASPQTKRWQLAKVFASVKQGDLVFIDEIHALLDGPQELLYPAIDAHRVPVVDIGTHRIKEGEWIEGIPTFTVIAATDQPGRLKNALQQRLVLRFTLQPYTESEMRVIVFNRASEMGILLSPQAARRIAQASRGIPRRARHLLQSLHTVMEDSAVTVSRATATRHLASLGIDPDNLTDNDRNYLALLARRSGCVGLETVALQMGLDDVTLKRDVETWLIHQELIGIGQGRYLTEKGKAYVKKRGIV